MQVVAADKFIDKATLSLDFMGGHNIAVDIATQPMEEVLKAADFISLHVPAQKSYVIDKAALQMMKKGAGIVNAARGGVVDESALVEALDNEHLAFAALDTFETEPSFRIHASQNFVDPSYWCSNSGGSRSYWCRISDSNRGTFKIIHLC